LLVENFFKEILNAGKLFSHFVYFAFEPAFIIVFIDEAERKVKIY